MPYCKEIDPIDTSKCMTCIDPNGDPNNECNCNDGYYFSTESLLCEGNQSLVFISYY